MCEYTSATMEGKRYEGFDLYDALEHISILAAPLRILTEDLFDLSEPYAMEYQKLTDRSVHPTPLTLGHTVNIKALLLLEIIREIEEKLRAFDINPA